MGTSKLGWSGPKIRQQFGNTEYLILPPIKMKTDEKINHFLQKAHNFFDLYLSWGFYSWC
ncbi:hypothetical protein S4054249_00790 [Pseudoalteromonas luteoviolacea]|uniref:Uncharacterized protein n=1 Tax=Pseudoalteromonas luteoviolacea S4054 TaxID=1129367 RepID=A0A0F6A751_9GAMM|nr:hypothetical protein S4054249_00790 [Pseudoalteromonas luteoviolacea]AOT11428.1 hypothetical protein S40542_00790 [Pseudoalteromonas luteoviolacea]AOT16341.1 hypothetical protein S4054_00790 [Pseudoalteromonas luteoviolacea]KKE81681.1 hypothetical protein N479_21450 [Pseudoalteromonas luteoviolacea S4054]KZN71180.1 hypothetical protein N481_19405 [Pseudoalteromonas luteoviolacea S4047-1]